MTAQYHIGDTFEVMARLPDNSVDLVLTSPPFLALRSYLPADHPNKGKEIGSEPTPAEFLDTLLALTAEWERLLAPHGSIAVELGDTYAGSGVSGWHRDGYDDRTLRPSEQSEAKRTGPRELTGWPQAKSLCIIPELYAACLAYGRNVLTGAESPAGQWRVRNLVRWVRPNPPVGALGDKYRPATSTMVVACKARDRWFDLDAVRTPFQHPKANERNGARGGPTTGTKGPNTDRVNLGASNFHSTHAGAPPLDWWNIPTHPYKGAHYATWPPALCERPIKSMCPAHVCRECGQPRRRIVERTPLDERDDVRPVTTKGVPGTKHKPTNQEATGIHVPHAALVTLGFTDCGHDNYRPGIVLDPFAGSGTTLAVATGHGRDAIGIDLDERNAELATERVGPMLLEVIR